MQSLQRHWATSSSLGILQENRTNFNMEILCKVIEITAHVLYSMVDESSDMLKCQEEKVFFTKLVEFQ